jgi:hypothetical protein
MPFIEHQLPKDVFRYVFAVSWPHQIALIILTVVAFLLEIVPLEIQRRVVNNLVKGRPFQLIVTLGAAYASAVLVQGATKLGLNVYRSWIGENATRDLRWRVLAYLRVARVVAPGSEARGVGAAMIVAEVEPIGGFVGTSISEPLLQAGILLSVRTRLHCSPRQMDGGRGIRAIRAAAGVRTVDTECDKPPRRGARLGLEAARCQHGRSARGVSRAR